MKLNQIISLLSEGVQLEVLAANPQYACGQRKF